MSAASPTRSAPAAALLALVDAAPCRGRGVGGSAGVESGRARATRGGLGLSGRSRRAVLGAGVQSTCRVREADAGVAGFVADGVVDSGPGVGGAAGGSGTAGCSTIDTAAPGGIAGGIATSTSTLSSTGAPSADGSSSVVAARPVSNVKESAGSDSVGSWIVPAPAVASGVASEAGALGGEGAAASGGGKTGTVGAGGVLP